MNATQKAKINKLISMFEDAQREMEEIRDTEQEKYDNMSENVQDSEKGQEVYDAIDNLESAITSLEDVTTSMERAVNG